MTSKTWVPGTVIDSPWLQDVNNLTYRLPDSSNVAYGDAMVAVLQPYTGAIARTQHTKNSDMVSVLDFGAVGDGVTNDTAAIQAAHDTGKKVFFPRPSSFYRIITPIALGGSADWTGEIGAYTIVRNTAGGTVFTCAGTGSLGPYSIKHMRFGGIGGVGTTVAGGGFLTYVCRLQLEDVHYESDLECCIRANLIFFNAINCTFGFFNQSGIHATHMHFDVSTGGGNNSNMNSTYQCLMHNGRATYASSLSGGQSWTFALTSWEGCTRNLAALNLSDLTLDHCYTERVNPPAGQAYDFSTCRTRTKVRGGQYLMGPTAAAGVSMFGVSTTCPFLLEDADVVSTATTFTYLNTNAISHSTPGTGLHHIKDCRISGNASDPLTYLDSLRDGGVTNWTPVPSGLTVVNGTGGASYAGTYTIRNRWVTVTIRIVTTGTCTTASTGNTTNFPLPTGVPVPSVTAIGGACNEAGVGAAMSLGNGFAYISGVFYPPNWAAQTGNIAMSVTYPI